MTDTKDGVRKALDAEQQEWWEVIIIAPFIIIGMLGILAISIIVFPFSFIYKHIKQ